jgi:mono/diheme cytochrome c family protein
MLRRLTKSLPALFRSTSPATTKTPGVWLVLALLCPALAKAEETNAEGLELFEKRIRPVLIEHCNQCHSAESKPLQAGLRVDTREGLRKGGESGAAVIPGKPGEGHLMAALKYEGLQMPPKGKLPANVIADFEKWIALGAPDSRNTPTGPDTVAKSAGKPGVNYTEGLKFWAFQKPVAAVPPDVKQPGWVRNDIDRFILARLEAAGLQPNAAADRQTLIRRAYFDVIGLPPSPEEIEAFVKDESPNAYETVIDRLLQSPHYGERWGRRWLDVARYGEDQAHTFKARNYPLGYRYRDWVVKALNDDMPYDRFLKMQIAADLLDGKDDPQQLAALGLFALGPVYYQDNGEQAKALADERDDRLDTLARGVWGLTLACARCHDHKFDPLSMQDYYGLLGVFSSSQYQERPIVPAEVLNRKAAAESQVKEQQLRIDQLLAREARSIRPAVSGEISQYTVASWIVRNRMKAKPNDKKLAEQVAKEQKLSEFLLKRWVDVLDPAKPPKPWLKEWHEVVKAQDPKADLSKDEAALAAVRTAGDKLQSLVQSKLPQRESLFARFGENVAFVNSEDVAQIAPGTIPLGNLFDDAKGVSLSSALASDKFKAAASEKSLGVDRVVQGWGNRTDVAPGIHIDFQKLGSTSHSYSSVLNDAWENAGGIRTKGERYPSNAPRTEQGIGMHANALITFDLQEIRQAGLLPADQKLTLRIDRAGFNDDTFGGGMEAYVAVLVTKPHAKADVYDAVLGLWVNGQPVKVEENDTTYYIAGDVPAPVKPDGKFATFNIPLSADARYVTLIAAAAGKPGDDNPINSDHTVFSGARLEYDVVSNSAIVDANAPAEAEIDSAHVALERDDAVLLSEFLYDQGLLALPAAECEARLAEQPAKELTAFKLELDVRKKASDAIAVPMAHALNEGMSKDHPIYILGNPKKPGDAAARSIPAILTKGERHAFDVKGSGRLDLAEMVASTDNPLTARVIVNRIWAGHFGFGLVRTPSNFGSLGERPTHPELLDWLACELMRAPSSPTASAWSLKSIHRLILLSATYQQSSGIDTKRAEIDPENRLLWRMNRQRLEVEPWRDAMLSVTGELDLAVGGPSIELSNNGNRRRTLYSFISRHRLDDLLRLFDFPDPNITSDRRTMTTVPLQQLFVLNSGFMTDRARALVKRLEADEAKSRNNASAPGTTPEDVAAQVNTRKIARAFELLFGRSPTEAELKAGLEFVSLPAEKEDALTPWEQFALALLGTNEFTFVD